MKIVKAALLGGLIAGALDIIYAFVVYGLMFGAKPIGILHTIASGLLGREAATAGGVQTAALGGAMHFAIAIVMAAVFVLTSRMLPILTRLPLIFGPLYGAASMAAMNYVIVPMSAIGGTGPEVGSKGFWIAVVAHVVFVGPAIALVSARLLKPQP